MTMNVKDKYTIFYTKQTTHSQYKHENRRRNKRRREKKIPKFEHFKTKSINLRRETQKS